MRKLVVPHFAIMVIFLFPPFSANALTASDVRNQTGCGSVGDDPNSNVEAHLARCKAVDAEARCHLSGGTPPPGATCGKYASDFNWNEGGALDSSNASTKFDSGFIPYLGTLSDRSSKCCGSATGCESVGKAPEDAGEGTRGSEVANAAIARYAGGNAAHRAGVCGAIQKICVDKVTKAQTAAGANATGVDWNRATSICAKMDPTSDIAAANDKFTAAKRSDEAADQTASKDKDDKKDSDDKKDPTKPSKDTASKDTPNKDANKKTPSSSSNPLSQLMQMAGPLMQQMAQQQQPQPDQTPPQPPQVASVQCGPGIVSAQCPATATPPTSDSFNKATGTSNFQTASTKNSGFNPPDANPTPGTNNRDLAAVSPQGQPLGSAVVPNGGGQMPAGSQTPTGGGGGGGGGGSISAAMGRPGDIMHGETSHSGGGFSAQNAAMSTATGGSGGWGSYGKGGGEAEAPVNWADWLPKGKNDPTRTLAGGNMRPAQIQSKEVNIFTRISDHIKSRCALGLLRDCVP